MYLLALLINIKWKQKLFLRFTIDMTSKQLHENKNNKYALYVLEVLRA